MKNYKIIIVVIILLLAGGVGYYFISKYDSTIPQSAVKNATKYDGNKTTINLDDLTYDGTGLSIENNTIYIVYGGTYELSGTTEANIVIETIDEEDVYLIFNGVSITSEEAPIYISQGDVYITLEDGTTNYIEYTKKYSETEEIDGAIYASDDLVIDGTGSLEVKSTYDGIVSKDTLTIENGTYVINASDDGIRGKDILTINNGNFEITSGGDALKSTNDTDAELGNIIINGGTFEITASGDGIAANTNVTIVDGTFNIKTGNGYTATSKAGDFGMWNNTTNKDSNDESIKGIKAGNLITISGGTFTLNTEDDGIHSNGNITISGGKFTISSTDDAIHADGLVEINGGEFTITASEGIEATYVKINDGNITIDATDDGINAGNKSNSYSTTVEINGGNVTIKMASGDTDGIDSNGNLYINGGTINITCNSPFDYDGEAKYNGGTLIVNGSQTTSITNQMMGGQMGGMQGNMNMAPQEGTQDNMPQGNMNRGMQENGQNNMQQGRGGRR
ncbi:MAG: carbohydrate-binding domain-containing protein [Bacilli bacterium]|nr:carbohydrate-binding domain-containing protein [Bacilli bacterium]